MDVATCSSVGLFDSGQGSGSPGSGGIDDGSRGAEFHRLRKLVDFHGELAGGASSLPTVQPSSVAGSSRTSTFGSVRSSVVRALPVATEGAGVLPGGPEKAFPTQTARGSKRGRSGETGQAPEAERKGQRQERRQRWRRGVKAGEPSEGGGPIQAGPLPSELSACSLLNSLPRHLLHLNSSLGVFARSILRQEGRSGPHTASTSIDPWPTPPPYPEAYREAGDDFQTRARKRAVNAMVVVLSHLHLREVRQAPPAMTCGRRLSSRQWSVIRRLEKMLDAWIIHPLVTSESMGRNAAKVEELDSVLGHLEAVLANTFHAGVYARPDCERLKPGRTKADAVQLGRSVASLGSTFKQLDPDRIAFVGEPRFDPAPFLDERGRDVFLHPLSEALPPEDYLGPLPSVQVHVAEKKRDDFLELLDASGRLALFRPEEVRQQFLSGVFAVGKDRDRDRLIMDSRRLNLLERPLGRWIRSLASGESLCRLQLLPHEALEFSGNDVRDFYHLFAISHERAVRNGLCMFIPEARCRHYAAYRAEEPGSSKIPCAGP